MKITEKKAVRRKILAESVRKGWRMLALLFFFTLLSAGVSSIFPAIAGESVDNILGTDAAVTLTFSKLRVLLILGSAALVLQFCLQLVRRYYDRSFLMHWIPTLLEKIGRVQLNVIETQETGYINKRVTSELRMIPKLLTFNVPGLIDALLVMIFSLYMLIRLLPSVSLVLAISALVIIPVALPILRRVRRLHKDIVEKWSRLDGITTYFIGTQKQMRAFNANERIMRIISANTDTAAKTDFMNSVKSMLLLSLILIVVLGGMVAFLLYAESTPEISTANAGTIVAFLGYMMMFVMRINGVTMAISDMQSSLAALDRMVEFLDEPEDEGKRPTVVPQPIGLLQIKNLATEINEKVVFQDFHLSARSGDVVVISGMSGCGKTTLLNTLYGLIPKLSGEIEIDSKEIGKFSDLGDAVVYLPQEIRFFNGSLRKNLEILAGKSLSNSAINAILQRVALENRLSIDDYDGENINEGGSNLSGGEKQRLAISTVLLREPAIALLDEPTSQLDSDTEEIIHETVRQMADNGTIVFYVAHKKSALDIATQVVKMERTHSPNL